MSKYKDTWGQIEWWKFSYEEIVHPEDIEKISPPRVGGVLHCIDEDNVYVAVKYGQWIFRIKSEAYKELPIRLSFEVGDWIKVKGSADKIGVIYLIDWHLKNQMPIFMLLVNGTRKSTNWYREDELEKLEPQNLEKT